MDTRLIASHQPDVLAVIMPSDADEHARVIKEEFDYMMIVSRISAYLPFGKRAMGTGSPAFFRAFLAQSSCFGLLQHVRIQNCLAFSDRSCEKMDLEHSSRYSQSCAIIATSSRESQRARPISSSSGISLAPS